MALSKGFLENVRQTVARHKMLAPGQRVAVALSGGVDSVVLLHALRALGYDVTALHFEHGIRGESSVRDMEFVVDYCASLGVPCEVERGDAPGFARENGLSIEVAARELRYKFFKMAMAGQSIDVCSTAHHLDDQAETLLMRLARGAAGGLEGIPYVNGPFIRPLRDISKARIVEYARAENLPFVVDETNDDTAIDRNLVRNEIMPLLQRLNPAAAGSIARSLAIAAQNADYIGKQAAGIIGENRELRLSDIDGLHGAVKTAVYAAFIGNLGAEEFSVKHIDALASLGRTGMMADIKGMTVINDNGVLRRMGEQQAPFEIPLGPPFSQRVSLPVGEIIISGPEAPPADPRTQPLVQYFDTAKLAALPGLVIRNRREGDRISPIGSGARKLKELFIDRKIPRDERGEVPLIASGSEVLWAAGVAASSKIAVDNGTGSVIKMEYINRRHL